MVVPACAHKFCCHRSPSWMLSSPFAKTFCMFAHASRSCPRRIAASGSASRFSSWAFLPTLPQSKVSVCSSGGISVCLTPPCAVLSKSSIVKAHKASVPAVESPAHASAAASLHAQHPLMTPAGPLASLPPVARPAPSVSASASSASVTGQKRKNCSSSSDDDHACPCAVAV